MMKTIAMKSISLLLAVMMTLIAFCMYGNVAVYADDAKTDWYEVTVKAVDKDWAFPGQSINVQAAARHLYYDEYGYLHLDENPSGIVYEWTIVENGEYADIKTDSSDPSIAVVTMKDYSKYESAMMITVNVKLKDKSGNVLVNDQYELSDTRGVSTLCPEQQMNDLNAGDSMDLDVEIRHYSIDIPDYELCTIKSMKWEFASEEVEIRDANGDLVQSEQPILVNQANSFRFTVKKLVSQSCEVRLFVFDENDTKYTRYYYFNDPVEPVTPEPVVIYDNPISAKAKNVTVKYTKLKKKTQTIIAKNVFTVKNAQGKLSYKLTKKDSKAKSKIKVSSGGKITVAKGLKKGTYKIRVKVSAAGNDFFKPGSKTVTVKITVK